MGCGDRNEITTLTCDSRELTSAPGTLFFALETASADGHRFIPGLYRAGVRNFVVRSGSERPGSCPEANFIITSSPLLALQRLARGIRLSHPRLTSVAITGSRGKTQIKEMVYSLLRPLAATVRSPRSFNSQIGVPLSLWEIDDDTKVGVFEAGISRPGEMEALESIIRPRIGIFTSLTGEHGENFESPEQKALEKALLFKNAEAVVYPENDGIILRALKAVNPGIRAIPCGGDNRSLALRLARLVAETACLPEVSVPSAPPEAISTRIDVLQALKDCLIIYDGFTHDLRSVAEALNFMRKRATPGRSSTVILAPLPEPGAGYPALASMLRGKRVKRLIIVGHLPDEAADVLKGSVERLETAAGYEDFMRRYSISDFSSELILVKGTAGMGFDTIASHLEAPRHETILEVNLNALVHNYNFFKSLLPPSSGLITMVKADAYGLGALEVSKTMQSQGAAMLAVAVVDEGVALRQAGITMPIVVMNPMGTNYKALFDYRLEPSVFSLRELHTLLRYAEIHDVHEYPVHIKLDTGMHRLGFLPGELDELFSILSSRQRLSPASVFSHLATADCLDKDEATDSQLSLFTQGADRLSRLFRTKLRRHILNTAGILRYPGYPSDMARLGIGLYGLSPLPPEVPADLRNVASLTTTVISLRDWPAGTHIGYGGKGVTRRQSVIATIPIGYADGLDRRLGNGNATVRVNGTDCPTVGNICMDQCMVDVTGADAAIGDKVTVFDSQADIRRLADTLGTITYEILASISPRVKRIYFRE